MSRVITFSTKFPSYHFKKGEPTNFVRSVWEGLDLLHMMPLLDEGKLEEHIASFYNKRGYSPKYHTIRFGHNRKVGGWFSPRIWSGNPYRSKQISIAPDLEIKYCPSIEIYKTSEIIIAGKFYSCFGTSKSNELALNDGLTEEEMKAWFKYPKNEVKDAQIICWNESIKY